MSDDAPPRPRTRLYLITPPRIEAPTAFRDLLLDALDGGDVASLQIRLKTETGALDEAATRALAAEILGPVQARDVAVLINDSPKLARNLGADGVHVGLDDTPVKEARAIVGPDAIVGATCKASRHAAMDAGEAGADYVAFGSFFPTSTKTDATPADPEILAWWQDTMELPCVAIGGITPENASGLVTAGADFLAVAAAVWTHRDGPRAAITQFNALLDALAGA
ncbi:MAG: thiamine phosphate synthase [Pseudomonadota bacterium]